jgi:glycosyltransferase involved in cell wall biosynthesis
VKTVKFDLILATYGRKDTLPVLFQSLTRQTYMNFRILIIDQNAPGFLDDILNSFSNNLDILRLHSLPGLSRARNVGLAHFTADAFALMDDDLIYEPDTLAKAQIALQHSDIAIGQLLETNVPRPLIRKCSCKKLHFLHEAFFKAPSATLFFRRCVANAISGFDEDIGAGTPGPIGSGAETDYLVRAMKAGFTVGRYKDILVCHPNQNIHHPMAPLKARRYGRGRYEIIRRHGLGRWFVLLNALHSLLKLLSRLHDKAYVRWQWHMFIGRLGG